MSALDFFAGCVGGAAGVFAGHPLDTVKVRLQTQPQGAGALYKGTWHCFKTIIKNEGMAGLYKGLSSPLASLTAINAVVFGAHRAIMRNMGDDSIKSHFLAGCAAGVAQAAIAAPSERLKLLIQIQNDAAHTQYRSPLHAAKVLVQQHGAKTVSRGFLATLMRDCPAFGIYFASYEYLARSMSSDGNVSSLGSAQLLLAGGGAGMLSWLFNYPTDVIKTRFQADLSYKGYWDCIRRTYASGGVRSFFVGLGSTLIRAFPSNAATFFTVEWTYRILLNYNVLGVVPAVERKAQASTVTMPDLWMMNCHHFLLVLPEAGSTSLDPMLHCCRFL